MAPLGELYLANSMILQSNRETMEPFYIFNDGSTISDYYSIGKSSIQDKSIKFNQISEDSSLK